MSAPAPAVRRTAVLRDEDHAIAAWMSAYVGASTSRTTGVPCEVMATVPVPVNVVLKTPPAIIDAPSRFVPNSSLRMGSLLGDVMGVYVSQAMTCSNGGARLRFPDAVQSMSGRRGRRTSHLARRRCILVT